MERWGESEREIEKGVGVGDEREDGRIRGGRDGEEEEDGLEERRRGEEVKLASNLITQINVAWREQLPKWTKEQERGRETITLQDA